MPVTAESEAHTADLLSELRETRAAILDAHPGARLLACWDLDGTLLCGDCCEGLSVHGRPVYPGLVQLAIEQGYAANYAANGGYYEWKNDYELLNRRFGPWLAYPFVAQTFAGADERALVSLAIRHFANTLSRHFYASSRLIFDALAEADVEQHVVSASPDFFVRGAAPGLGLTTERLHGLRVRVVDGLLTRDLLPPATLAEGKSERLRLILEAPPARFAGRPAFVLAGFGNSFAVDGAFLRLIAQQRLPAGQPLAVIINAGIPPPNYRRKFRSVRQTRVIGGG